MEHFGARFGALIARKREDRGWSFAQLAVAAYGDDGKGGESRKADVQKIETGGSKKPNAATIRKYRLALDLTQDEIDGCRTPEEIELAAFARELFEVIVEGAKAAGLTEDLALSVSDHYAQNNLGNFEGALASLKAALEVAAKEQERGRLPSNYETAVNDVVARVNRLNRDGEVDQAYEDLKAEAARRKEQRDMQTAEDGRVIDLLITQATMANDADGFAEAHLEKIQLDCPNIEDCFERLREQYIESYNDGLRFGTIFAFSSAQGLAQKCVEIAPTDLLRAKALNNLAIALRNQGTRTVGRSAVRLLEEAVGCCRSALALFAEGIHSVDKALVMQNLGIALEELSIRTPNANGAKLLAEAVQNYRSALNIRTEVEHPEKWAMTTQNLAGALQRQGLRSSGQKATVLLAEAVKSYRAALRVRKETVFPEDWAITMHNLGIALKDQGLRTNGVVGRALLSEAIASYRSVLRVSTKTKHPVHWAMTQVDLAIAETEIARHITSRNPRAHYEAALTHIDNSLQVYDPEQMSYDHQKATRVRGQILEALSSSSS